MLIEPDPTQSLEWQLAQLRNRFGNVLGEMDRLSSLVKTLTGDTIVNIFESGDVKVVVPYWKITTSYLDFGNSAPSDTVFDQTGFRYGEVATAKGSLQAVQPYGGSWSDAHAGVRYELWLSVKNGPIDVGASLWVAHFDTGTAATYAQVALNGVNQFGSDLNVPYGTEARKETATIRFNDGTHKVSILMRMNKGSSNYAKPRMLSFHFEAIDGVNVVFVEPPEFGVKPMRYNPAPGGVAKGGNLTP